MRKFTLFIASLFLAVGAMAQTFVEPVTGKYYKIKGDSQSLPWVTANTNSSGSVAVSANEADAAVFEKTANGFKAVSTGKYLGYTGGKFGYSDTEITVELVNTGSQANDQGKYAIKSGGNWMYNNNTDGIVHESDAWLDLPRLWGFIEVNMGGNGDGEDDGKVVADGVYLIKNNYNNRGAMAYGTWGGTEYFGLTEITLNGCAANNLDVADNSYKYWYVKTTDKGIYFYNIGKGYFLQEHAQEKATCAEAIANGFVMVERTANNTKYVSVKNGNYYLSYSCGWAPNSAGGSVRWLTDDEAAATLMTFTAVDATPYYTQIQDANTKIAAFEKGNEEEKAALAEAIEQAEALLATITIGDGVGEYSGNYTAAEIESVLGSMKNYYNAIDSNTAIADIEGCIDLIEEAIASYTLNMPVAGSYFRIKAVEGWNDDARYLTSTNTTVSGKTTRAAFVANADANTIFYFDGTQLLSYATGNFLVSNSGFLGYNGVQTTGIDVAFAPAANGLLGAYKISFANGGRCLFVNQDNYTDAGSGTDNRNGYCFNLEPVVELPVTITSAGYATFYAPVAVNIPDGVKAYTVSVNEDGWADLEEIVISFSPNVGVVLAAEEGTYYLPISEDNTVYEGNALRGTVAATYITDDAYVLGIVDNEVGFYTATKNQQENTAWKNNSHKAYLPKAVGLNAASYSFRFGEGTTGIDEMTEQRAESKEIYDITGRRVENVTAPGIYIVGGKKVLVK